MRAHFLKQPPPSSMQEQELQATAADPQQTQQHPQNPTGFPLEPEDLSAFYLGRCCLREACYFATPLLKMRFCPYCATEMTTVHDFFALFQLPSTEPFSLEPAKKRYRQLLSMFHPDLDEKHNEAGNNSASNSDHARDFLLVSQAWQTLGNEDLRAEYRKMLAKCRTSLLMEQDFADGKDSPQPSSARSPFLSVLAVNTFLSGMCLVAAGLWLHIYWGKMWFMLGGVSFIMLTIISFSKLYAIFALTLCSSLFVGFLLFCFQWENWSLAGLFFVGFVLSLHFYKKWRDALHAPSQPDAQSQSQSQTQS